MQHVGLKGTTNVGVNLFGYERERVYPMIISKLDREIDLLLISNGETKHYCWIKNFNRLCASHTENSTHSMHHCKRCLRGYHSIESLNKHIVDCSQHDTQRIELPKSGSTLTFKNYNRSMRVPFVVYADFESFLKPISLPNPAESYTYKIKKHSPSSFCYHIKCFDDSLFKQNPVTFTAENEDDDVAQIFVDTLEQNIRDIYQQFKFAKNMVLTKENKVQYSSATTCHICDNNHKNPQRNLVWRRSMVERVHCFEYKLENKGHKRL